MKQSRNNSVYPFLYEHKLVGQFSLFSPLIHCSLNKFRFLIQIINKLRIMSAFQIVFQDVDQQNQFES